MRTARRPLRRRRSLLGRPARPIGSIGGVPPASRDICAARLCRSRWADELRTQHQGCVSSNRRLYRPHPQGCQAGGPAGRAAEQVRVGRQCGNCQDARPQCAADAARYRRRGDRVKRREFIALAGATAVWPHPARAQQSMPVIGYLTTLAPTDRPQLLEAFRQGLNEAGYADRRNVAIEYRFADNQLDRLRAMAAELITRKVDVIAATGGNSTGLIVKTLTSTIPVVFTSGADPVQAGLVASLSRPEANVTGVSWFNVDAGQKHVGLLRELLPRAELFAV